MHSITKRLLLVLALVSLFSVASGTITEAKPTIRFGDTQFQSLWINNAIAMFIVEHGYDYPTEVVTLSTPIFRQVFPQGDIDVHMELWRVNIMEWYNKVTSEGSVIDLGPTYDRATQGWYVPRYVVEGDPERGIEPMAPDLKSVDQLPEYKDLFKDPEDPSKGQFVSCIMGWSCQVVNQTKFQAYGLYDSFNILEPGTAPALDAAIAGAYKKGKPIVFYYWEPTWLLGMYDMYQLEEPPYNEECGALIKKVMDGEMEPEEVTKAAGCAYKTVDIHKGVHKSLLKRAPELVEFLKKMNVGTDQLNKTAAYMQQEDAEADEAALWFFAHYPERWRAWIPEDAAKKVEAALKDEGVTLLTLQ